MIHLIFQIIAISCTDSVFVIPDGENASVYIALNEEDLPASYIITELVNENFIKESIKTYKQRSKLESIGQYPFEKITVKDRIGLKSIFNSFKYGISKNKKKTESFLNSYLVAVAKIPNYKNKKYIIDLMKPKDFCLADTYSTSKKLFFNEFPNFYLLEFCRPYNCSKYRPLQLIPSLYQNALLFSLNQRTININQNNLEINEKFESENEVFNKQANDESEDKIINKREVLEIRNDFTGKPVLNNLENEKSDENTIQETNEEIFEDLNTQESSKKIYLLTQEKEKNDIYLDCKVFEKNRSYISVYNFGNLFD
ncbi:putative SP-containing protein [Vairimorpha necatrix]|uniref:SP-containing protein n=1 Tax=Vairimorpha necatrix TaxID=6039 RepID=A0AAX4JEC9_9MICR